MIPPNVLNKLASKLGVSENELQVLSRALAGESLPIISKQLGVQKAALQKRLGEVYRKFGIEGAGPGKFAKLQQALMALYEEYKAEQHQPSESPGTPTPTVSQWIGRTQELITLKRWILEENSRLIWVVGVGGVGKTALVHQLQRGLESQFQQCYQRSVRDAPPSELLQEILGRGAGASVSVESLIGALTMRRCLIIFDDIESLGTETEYNDLWQQIGQIPHQSCLVLTSWQIPPSLQTWSQTTPSVRILELSGLPIPEAQEYLKPYISPDLNSELLLQLIHLYGANPGLLSVMAMATQHWESSQWGDLLKKTPILIQRQIGMAVATAKLSDLEINLLLGLSIYSHPLTAQELSETLDLMDITQTQMALNVLTDQGWLQTEGEPPRYRLSHRLQQAIIHPLLAKHLNELGHQFYREGEFKTAATHLKRALRYQPKLSAALYNLGATYEQLQNWQDAMLCYQQLNSQEDSSPVHSALNNQARLYLLGGQISDAMTLLMGLQARVRVPEIQAAIAKNLGWGYWLQTDYEQAERLLQQSLELQPQFPAACYLLAQVYQAQNRIQDAHKFWSKALELDQRQRDSGETPWRLPEMEVWRLQALQYLQRLQ